MDDLNPASLVDLHARVLFAHDGLDDITGLNESAGGPGPLVYLGRSSSRVALRFSPAVQLPAREAVRAFAATLPPWRPRSPEASLVERLASAAGLPPHAEAWAGPVFRFPPPVFPPMGAMELYPVHARLLHPELATLGPSLSRRRPAFTVIRGGQAVSVCYSSRSTANAAEAGVETVAAFRGQGCAGLAVTAWADAVRRAGRLPFYSTSWENAASLAVAAKLDLIEFGEDIHLT